MGDKNKQQKQEHLHCKGKDHGKACKHEISKFGFCKNHFEEFKFGLINKHGDEVLDHEKKLDQFKTWKAKQKLA